MAECDWRVAFASVIGTSHVSSGLPCQDFAVVRFVSSADGKALVAVASDGAGSAVAAEVGAQLASEAIAEAAVKFLVSGSRVSDLSREAVAGWIEDVLRTLEERAEADGNRLIDYACTLVVAIVGENASAFFQIGDGAIVVSDGDSESWSYIFWPQHGEFANTTNFVTSPDVLEVFEFEVSPRPLNEFAVFTDGLEHMVLLHSPRSVHQPFFDTMLKPVRASDANGTDGALCESLGAYLNQPVVCERTDDDKTLILATRVCQPVMLTES